MKFRIKRVPAVRVPDIEVPAVNGRSMGEAPRARCAEGPEHWVSAFPVADRLASAPLDLPFTAGTSTAGTSISGTLTAGTSISRLNAALAIGALLFFSSMPASSQTLPDLPTVTNSSLTLKEALRVAAVSSVTLKQARADAGIAAASARSADAPSKVSVSATTYGTAGDSANILTTSPGVLPQNIFSVPPHGFADQNLMLMVPLSTGGKLKYNSASANKQNEAAELNRQAAGLTVMETVTEDYTNVLLQSALVAVAQSRLTAEDEQVREITEKVSAGRLAPVDLLREQAEQADTRQALLAAQSSAQLALVTLKTTLGISQVSQIAPSDSLDMFPAAALPADLADALRQADTHRPELAAAMRQIEAASSAVKAAQGAYAPQIYGVAMADASAGAGAGRTGYTIGLTASLPLYDGGLRRADSDAARARLERAQADALQVRQRVDQQVAAAWLTVQTVTAQVPAANAGVISAQKAYELAKLRDEAGKSVAAERLAALASLTRAQGALAQAKAGLIVAHAQLQAALGNLQRP